MPFCEESRLDGFHRILESHSVNFYGEDVAEEFRTTHHFQKMPEQR